MSWILRGKIYLCFCWLCLWFNFFLSYRISCFFLLKHFRTASSSTLQVANLWVREHESKYLYGAYYRMRLKNLDSILKAYNCRMDNGIKTMPAIKKLLLHSYFRTCKQFLRIMDHVSSVYNDTYCITAMYGLIQFCCITHDCHNWGRPILRCPIKSIHKN